tara:strand:+ start:6506 stop:6868 length:363 start_codon:yes stop_codon:yes gene_type:complete
MKLLFLLALSFSAFTLSAQGLDFNQVESLFSNVDPIYGALVILGGYVSAFIPGLKKINSGVYRVLAFALVTGIGFFSFGADVFSLSVTYFFSTSLYEVVLKSLVAKSPKPKEFPVYPNDL